MSGQETQPGNLLFSRPGWHQGWAGSASGRVVAMQWVATVIWNALAIPVGSIALFGNEDLGPILPFILVLFPIVGVLLFGFAIRETLRWRRFGSLRVRLDPHPGSIGGHVGGSLELPVHQLDAESLRVSLYCLNDRLVKTSDGSARKESTVWSDEVIPAVERSGRGLRVRFTFAVPPDAPPTDEPSDDYHKWVFRVHASMPGADLYQTYEIPVFKVDPVCHADRPALGSSTSGDPLTLSDNIVRVKRQGGGLTLHYPVGRGGYSGIMLLVFGAVFVGMGTFFFGQTVSMMDGSAFAVVFMIFSSVFLVIFGGVGGLIMLLGLYTLMNSLVVEIRNGTVSTRRWFFVPFSREVGIDQIDRVEMDVNSRMGEGAKAERRVRVRAFLKDGGRVPLGDDVPWGQQSEALSSLLSEELGMPVAFVEDSNRGLKLAKALMARRTKRPEMTTEE